VAELGSVLDAPRTNSDFIKLLTQPELMQNLGRMRHDVDADAKGLDILDRLENFDIESLLMQAKRGGQATNARTSKNDTRHNPPFSAKLHTPMRQIATFL
jgi:hypothetical protein